MTTKEIIHIAEELQEQSKFKYSIALIEGNRISKTYEEYRLLSNAYWRLGDNETAKYNNERALELCNDENLKSFHRAFSYYLEERWGPIVSELSDLHDPPIVHMILGKALTELGKTQDNRDLLLQAEKSLAEYYRRTHDFGGLMLKANAQIQYGKPVEAIQSLTELLELTESLAHRAEALIKRGSLYYQLSSKIPTYFDLGLKDISEHLELDPSSYLGFSIRFEMLYRNREWKKSLEDVRMMLLLKPLDRDALMFSASIKSRLGEYSEAIKDLELSEGHAKGLKPDHGVMMDIAFNRRKLGEIEKALSEYQTILVDPELETDDKARLLFNRASLYGEEFGDWLKALEDYQEAFTLNPDRLDNKLFLAKAHHNCGKTDEAENLYKELPNNPEAVTNLGILYYSTDQEKGWDHFNKAVEMAENSPNYVPLKNRAYYFQLRKEWNSSISDLEDATSNLGDLIDPEIDYRLDICKRQLKYEEAYQSIPKGLSYKNELDGAIESIIQKSQNQVLEENDSLVHYTNLTVAQALIDKGKEGAFLWAGEVSYMNDPQEGKALIEYLSKSGVEVASFLKNFESKKTEEDLKIFSISFNRQTTDQPASDELLLWRLYGRSEEGKDAGGCSLTVDSKFYQKSFRVESDGAPGLATKNKIFALRKVHYLDPSETSLDNLQAILEKIIKLCSTVSKSKKEIIEDHIFWNLAQVAYLFKTKHYEYEKEVRLIHVRSLKTNPEEVKIFKPTGGAPRIYMEYNQRSVLRHLQSITLGPKADQKERWKTYFEFKKKVIKADFRIDTSEIDFA